MLKRFLLLLLLLGALCLPQTGFAQPAADAAPCIRAIDLSREFRGLRGTAVFYAPSQNQYAIYQPALAETRSSPCSTFKIFSAYVGLMTGRIDPYRSLRRWNGTVYWLPQWNQDITLKEAFGCSCIWYFRQVIDEIGPEAMQNWLDRFAYGNRDCSDWSGERNTNEPLYDLKGFWIESPLAISPREQTEVLSRLFAETDDPRRQSVQSVMRSIMLVETDPHRSLTIYGKTGFGVVDGKPTDAWFVGFYTKAGQSVYFAVRLADPDNPAMTSAAAREIALSVIRTRRDLPL